MARRFLLMLLCILSASSAAAQVSGPTYSFTAGTIISPTEVNSNFSTIYSSALNRFGGTQAGPFVFSPDNTYDIGASGTTRPRDLWLGRNASVGGTLAVTGTATFSGAVTISTGSIPETAITDGTLLARVGDGENITGQYTFTSAGGPIVSSAAPRLNFIETGGTANQQRWKLFADSSVFMLATLNDAESVEANAFSVQRTSTTVTTFTIFGTQLTVPDALRFSGGTTSGFSYAGGVLTVAENNVTLASWDSALGYVLLTNITLGSQSFAGLGTPANGTLWYCTDCTIANPCASGGSGAVAKRINSTWICN